MNKEYSKILVTGGAGFIGSHITDKLLNEGFEVTVVDDLSTGRLENIAHHQDNKYFHFIKVDIRNFDNIKEIVTDKDVIFHEAAITSVPFSVRQPIITNDINVRGTLNLLKSCLDTDVKRFIFASSASVYGEISILPIKEEMSLNPKSPYAVSKIAAEHYANLFYNLYGLETIILRYFNVYGPRARENQGVISKFINLFLKNERPIIFGDGEQTRDFINVNDVAHANILALSEKKAVGEIINIGTGVASSINQIVNLLQETLDKKHISPRYVNPRAGDVRHGYFDITKAQKYLNFYPKITLKEGICQISEWYKNKFLRS
ncbi:MAG: SDR family NAD(P)-dependent oxidoreductase [Candidatus Hodarchaeota archaeon]